MSRILRWLRAMLASGPCGINRGLVLTHQQRLASQDPLAVSSGRCIRCVVCQEPLRLFAGAQRDRIARSRFSRVLYPLRISPQSRCYTPLRRAASIAGGKRNRRWKLIVNVEVEPDE